MNIFFNIQIRVNSTKISKIFYHICGYIISNDPDYFGSPTVSTPPETKSLHELQLSLHNSLIILIQNIPASIVLKIKVKKEKICT